MVLVNVSGKGVVKNSRSEDEIQDVSSFSSIGGRPDSVFRQCSYKLSPWEGVATKSKNDKLNTLSKGKSDHSRS